MSKSNLTVDVMDRCFVAAAHGNSSPFTSHPDQWDSRVPSKYGGSPFFMTVSESSPMASGGEKLWLSMEAGSSQSPLNPDGTFLEQSSVAEPLGQFNNSSIVEVYGSKMSTPYKKQGMETSDPMLVDLTASKLPDSEVVVNASGLQKTGPPMWEISEINSALELNSPSLEVSICDLRFQSISSECETSVPSQTSASPLAQWVGVKHKDSGITYLQPFRYRRQLSASEVPILATPVCYQPAAGSPDQPAVTAKAQAT